MDFSNNTFTSQEYLSYIDNTSPPSTGSSSSYSTFQYPPFSADSNTPNSCLPNIQNYETSDEWQDYSPNEHFQNLPLWSNDCDSSLNFSNTQVQTNNNNVNEKKK